MQDEAKGPGAYVRRVRRDTQRYVEDLLGENEKLRRQVVVCEDEAAAQKRAAERSEDAVRVLRDDLRREREEHESLRCRLEEIQGESRTFSERYVQVEQQNNDLANLYVAGYRLHGTLNRQEVLDAILEIIINLVGCEEFVIYEADPENRQLRLAASFGVDAGAYRTIAVGSGLIGTVASTGEAYLADRSDGAGATPLDANLTACIPLRVDNRVTGVIAIFELLPQKESGLGTLDHEMLDLLSAQAGIALYCTALHARFATEVASAGLG